MRKRGTHRVGLAMSARLGVIALLTIVGMCLMVSPLLADEITRWFDPILLTNPSTGGSMEVVLGVSPGVGTGPFEYVYWVTNNAATPLSDFYFTCVGVPDLSSFVPDAYTVSNGTRISQNEFWWDGENHDWGNVLTKEKSPLTRQLMVFDQTTSSMVASTKFRWSSLIGNGMLPGETLGFSFTSIFAPSETARSIASGLAVRGYNGTRYAYGPGPETVPVIPEWPAITMALSGLGGLGVIRRRFRRR